MLHKEILASTAEHTAALHDRFAKPVPCRDKTKLLLTLRQWLTDLKELQRPQQDLLAPSDPGKLYFAIERKAAGWAVMDADARGDKCRFSHKGSDKSGGKGGNGKKANNERDRCKKCGKTTQSRVQRLSRSKLR